MTGQAFQQCGIGKPSRDVIIWMGTVLDTNQGFMSVTEQNIARFRKRKREEVFVIFLAAARC